MLDEIYTLDDFDLKGKTVLCRLDINSPLSSKTELRDYTRIERCLPTVKELLEKGAKAVLMSHQGGDLEYHNYGSTAPHAVIMSKLLGREVKFIDDVCGPAARSEIAALEEGEALLLDNVRFMAEEMTLFEDKLKLSPAAQAETIIVRKLAPLADLFVCDAFAAVHRSQPTLVGLPQVLPSSMGRLFEKEYSALMHLRDNPGRPSLFVLGGAKIEDAFLIMRSVLPNNAVDGILTGGLVSNILLAAGGFALGKPSMDFIKEKNLDRYIEPAKELLDKYRDLIVLPVDYATLTPEGKRSEALLDALPAEEMIVDIGAKTAAHYAELIKTAKTVFINGPMGVFENEPTAYGTEVIFKEAAASKAYSILGGGDSIAAANKFGTIKDYSYVSTAGGGLIRFLAGQELPVVQALKEAAKKFPQ